MKILRAMMALALFLALNNVSFASSLPASSAMGSYVFYGYAPSTISNFTMIVDGKPVFNYTRFPARLYVVGVNDTTHVELHNLTTNTLIASKTLNRMELWTITLGTRVTGDTVPPSEETYFKLVADRFVAAYAQAGIMDGPDLTSGSSTFYPSTDGGFVGKEFIFVAANSCWSPGIYLIYFNMHLVLGVEDSHVTIYNSSSHKVAELDVAANSLKTVTLESSKVYRLVSTGRVMVAGLAYDSFLYLPSLTGGFVGKHFYGTMPGGREGAGPEALLAAALEDTRVRVYDLTRPSWHLGLAGPDLERSLRAGEEWFNASIQASRPLRFESTGNITVLVGRGSWHWAISAASPNLIGDDIAFIGARADQAIQFYAFTGAVLFAWEDSIVEVDGASVRMTRDSYLTILSGLHVVKGSAPLTIEVLNRGEGWRNWGEYLIAEQTLEATYPPPPAIGGLAELGPYIALAIALPVILAISLMLRRRGRARGRV